MRLAGQAKAGYYPYPDESLTLTLPYLFAKNGRSLRLFDSCAGEGTALAAIGAHLRNEHLPVQTYGIELAHDRAVIAEKKLNHVINGDYWLSAVSNNAMSLVLCNPPYDWAVSDKGERTRAELVFLKDNTTALMPGGILVGLFPLSTAAREDVIRFLVRNYEDLRYLQVTEADFPLFKQIVIFGRKKKYAENETPKARAVIAYMKREVARLVPPSPQNDGEVQDDATLDPNLFSAEEIEAKKEEPYKLDWPETLPILGADPHFVPYEVPAAPQINPLIFRLSRLNPEQLARLIADHGVTSGREWHAYQFERTGEDLFTPIVPLRNGHLMSLMTTGQIGTLTLREGVAKGKTAKVAIYYDDDDNPVEEKDATQAKEAFTTTLAMLKPDGELAVVDEAKQMEEIFLANKEDILEAVLAKYQPVYDGHPDPAAWAKLSGLRPKHKLPGQKEAGLTDKQKHIVMAALASWERNKVFGNILGMGGGKTFQALAAAWMKDLWPAIVLTPGHIARKWVRSAEELIPNVVAVHVKTIADLEEAIAAYEPGQKLVVVLDIVRARRKEGLHGSYITRKIGYKEKDDDGIVHNRIIDVVCCPDCGTPYSDKKHPWFTPGDFERYHFPKKGNTRKPICQHVLDKPGERKVHRIRTGGAAHQRYQDILRAYPDPDNPNYMRVPIQLRSWEHGLREPTEIWVRLHVDRYAEAKERTLHRTIRLYNKHAAQDFTAPAADRHTSQNTHLPALKGVTICGSPLYEFNGGGRDLTHILVDSERADAEGKPNVMYPVAEYIKRQYPDFFRLLIADECHKYTNRGRDQARAYHHLLDASEYVMNLTGTIFNGKASNLFNQQFWLNPEIRRRYRWNNVDKWVEDFGRKVYKWSESKDKDEDGKSAGAQGGRKRSNYRSSEIPGISPSVFRHLLPTHSFASLEDMGIPLPPFKDDIVFVEMTPEQEAQYSWFYTTMLGIIQEYASSFDSYRMRCGQALMSTWFINSRMRPDEMHRRRDIWWNRPAASKDEPSETVPFLVRAQNITDPAYDFTDDFVLANQGDGFVPLVLFPVVGSAPTPKERAMINAVAADVQNGHKCIVYLEQTGTRDIQPRIKQFLRDAGVKAVILPKSVSAEKREEWIMKNADKMDALILNPQSVETGLDLVMFSRGHVYEPNASLTVFWQSMKRLHRPGQAKDVKFSYYLYQNTVEAALFTLIAEKMRSNNTIYGGDLESAVAAQAGSTDNLMAELTARLLKDQPPSMNGIAGFADMMHGDAEGEWELEGEDDDVLAEVEGLFDGLFDDDDEEDAIVLDEEEKPAPEPEPEPAKPPVIAKGKRPAPVEPSQRELPQLIQTTLIELRGHLSTTALLLAGYKDPSEEATAQELLAALGIDDNPTFRDACIQAARLPLPDGVPTRPQPKPEPAPEPAPESDTAPATVETLYTYAMNNFGGDARIHWLEGMMDPEDPADLALLAAKQVLIATRKPLFKWILAWVLNMPETKGSPGQALNNLAEGNGYKPEQRKELVTAMLTSPWFPLQYESAGFTAEARRAQVVYQKEREGALPKAPHGLTTEAEEQPVLTLAQLALAAGYEDTQEAKKAKAPKKNAMQQAALF